MSSLFVRSVLGFFVVGAAAFAADASDLTTPAPSASALAATPIPDRYIVQVTSGTDASVVAASHGIVTRFVYRRAVQGFAATVPSGRLAALISDPRVLSVVPDRVVAAIAKPGTGGGGGGTTPPPQVVPAGVQRIGAAPSALLGFNGSGVGVAVVDTGVDLTHEDLPGVRDSFSAFGGSAQDNNGHGTHVAGIIAAADNAVDVVGVAPGATIYAVKVLDASGSGSDSDVIAGLDWVAQHATSVTPNIRVVNMSLGRAGTVDDNPPMKASVDTLHDNGIAVVVAAGNDAKLEISQQVPACYPKAMAVASSTAKTGTSQSRFVPNGISADTASYFTTDGVGVAISAPGEDEEDVSKSSLIQSVGILSTKLGGGTTRMSGTSMASPHTAGVAALLFSKNSSLTADDIRAKLIAGADRPDVAPLDSPTSSYSFDGLREGILYAPRSLQAVP